MEKFHIKESLIILFYWESKFLFFLIHFFYIFSKEGLEKELSQIESDMKKISPSNVVVDMTK
jgi:hypothetical protein